jgi:hypothetical protein
MPLPFALLLGFALGVALASVAKAELAREGGPLVTSRPLVIVAAFAGIVFTPIVGYFLAFHGDWAYLYAVSWQSIPSALDLALVLAAGASIVAGFVVAVPPVRARNARVVGTLVGAPSAIALVLFAIGLRRLGVSASYSQFHGGFGIEPITSSALGKSVLLAVLVLAAGIAWTVRSLAQTRSAR